MLKIKNYSKEDFTGKYNGIQYIIKTGETKTFEDHIAKHLASYIARRELARERFNTLEDGKKRENLTWTPDEEKAELNKALVGKVIFDTPIEEDEDIIEVGEEKETTTEEDFDVEQPKEKVEVEDDESKGKAEPKKTAAKK